MRHLKDNKGFTLIELLVSIASASVVLGAASLLLLMCVRTQRDVFDAAKEQRTVRTLFAMVENLTTESDIDKVEADGASWDLLGKDSGNVLLRYDSSTGSVFIGENDSAALSGLLATAITIDENLLTLSLTTKTATYETSGYCRIMEGMSESGNSHISGDMMDTIEEEAEESSGGALSEVRKNFIAMLLSQYGSGGRIDGSGQYYAQWYNPEWNTNTPWCACYLSWAAAQQLTPPKTGAELHETYPYIFADVDYGWEKMTVVAPESIKSGDYIFFDWEGGLPDGAADKKDPDHVGAVLYINGNTIFTIEGNSGNRVAIRSYDKADPRIMGYRTFFS